MTLEVTLEVTFEVSDVLRSERWAASTCNSGENAMGKNDPSRPTRPPDPRPACPVCGGPLLEIRAKLQCARCHTICETCCEGGRG